MKKLLLIGVLVCAILASVVTGTLAVYQVSIEAESGDIIAKTFEFNGEGDADFSSVVKLAPGESTKFVFYAKNFTGSTASETPMTVKSDFDITGGNKAGLEVSVKTSVNGSTVSGNNITLPANVESTIMYEITVTWPTNGTVNEKTEFAGANLGKLAVKLVATQA